MEICKKMIQNISWIRLCFEIPLFFAMAWSIQMLFSPYTSLFHPRISRLVWLAERFYQRISRTAGKWPDRGGVKGLYSGILWLKSHREVSVDIIAENNEQDVVSLQRIWSFTASFGCALVDFLPLLCVGSPSASAAEPAVEPAVEKIGQIPPTSSSLCVNIAPYYEKNSSDNNKSHAGTF